MPQRLFIGGSEEALDVCRDVQAELERDFEVVVWDQDVFKLGHSGLDSLLDMLDSSDAGIFVLRADDLSTSRDEAAPVVRDNVILELGMFIGRLGRDRTFMLTPSTHPPRLPSDLLGVTTAKYKDEPASFGAGRASVGPACTKIRRKLTSLQLSVAPEPEARERLDRAMRRLSRDLGRLLGGAAVQPDPPDGKPLSVNARFDRTSVVVEAGRIQDHPMDNETVVALPANEYFDDECIHDAKSSLGAYVLHHFKDSQDKFRQQVRVALSDFPTQRVPRGVKRIDDSYGIGRAIFLSGLAPQHRIILVSATTERAAVGLRAEPHFLYAAVQGILETLGETRRRSLAMPVLGSGHGGIPLTVALLFNLLAVKSHLDNDESPQLRRLRIVVFDADATQATRAAVEDVLSNAGAVVQ